MKKVLFVCVENSCRSQMAEGWARKLGAGKIQAFSAGSRPSGKVNPDAVTVMSEAGVDISGNASKGIEQFLSEGIDYAVSMGCGDNCPFVPAENRLSWNIEDPKNRGMDFFRKVRDQIRDNVAGLIGDIVQK